MTSQEIRDEEKNLGNRNPLTPFQYFQMETGLENPTEDAILQYFQNEEDDAKKKGEEHPFKVLGYSNIGYKYLYDSLAHINDIKKKIQDIQNTIAQLKQEDSKLTWYQEKIKYLKKIIELSQKFKQALDPQLQPLREQINHANLFLQTLLSIKRKDDQRIGTLMDMCDQIDTNDGSLRGLLQAMKGTFQTIKEVQEGVHQVGNYDLDNRPKDEQDDDNLNSTVGGWTMIFCDEQGKELKLNQDNIMGVKGKKYTINGLTPEEYSTLMEKGKDFISSLEDSKLQELKHNQITSNLLQNQQKQRDLENKLKESRKSFFEKDLSLDFLEEDLIDIPEKTRKGIMKILGSQKVITLRDLKHQLKINYTKEIERILTKHHCFRE